MTKQNMVVADAKPGFNMDISMAVSGSCLFTSAAQRPPAVPGTYITISKKKLLQNLDINSGARINTWIDSMRASSPTHIKAPPLSGDQNSWIVSPLTQKGKKKIIIKIKFVYMKQLTRRCSVLPTKAPSIEIICDIAYT